MKIVKKKEEEEEKKKLTGFHYFSSEVRQYSVLHTHKRPYIE